MATDEIGLVKVKGVQMEFGGTQFFAHIGVLKYVMVQIEI